MYAETSEFLMKRDPSTQQGKWIVPNSTDISRVEWKQYIYTSHLIFAEDFKVLALNVDV